MNTVGVGGVLLRWVAERGGGKVAELRQGIRGTAQSYGLRLTEYAHWDWMRTASALGFLDLDLRADRWSAAPLVLTRLPHADGLALITGARTAAASGQLQRAAEDWLELLMVPDEPRDGAVPLPDTLLVQYDDPDLLPESAQRLGARFVPCAALQLAELLPRTAAGPEAAPPGGSGMNSLEQYDIGKRRFEPVAAAREDGLYRWRGADNARLVRARRNSVFYRTERETGVYLELARHRQNAVRWRAEPAAGRSACGPLFVDRGVPMPPLHQRAAVLCTGLPPRTGAHGETLAYDNVPRVLAEAIAASLLQKLEVLPQPAAAATGRAK
ncbi:hypothetical protein [Streptomyces sp. PvR018]|uniref:hypothetical protein n=1 Tax=Streptomyces sp. PvR018 TaxID=3156442 RepID=UPI001A2A3526|nr:hypothetical protein [Streptomyces sp. MBT57]